MAGRLQNEDFKTEAELVAAGGAKSQLLNDTKLYVTGNSINKTLDDAIKDGDIGGDVNQILSYNFESGVSALTGEVGFTVASNTTTPLSGIADAKLTIAAGDQSTKKVKVNAFSVDQAFRASILTLSFDCLTGTGYVDNKVGVYLRDVTNSVTIYPADQGLKASSLSSKRTYQFQTSATGASYEIWFQVDSTNTTTSDIYIDNLTFGVKPVVKGAFVSDWQSYTPTITNGGTTSLNVGKYRRVGDTVEIQIQALFTGAGSAANLYFSIPSGLSLDTNKLAGTLGNGVATGIASWYDAGTAEKTGVTYLAGTNSIFVVMDTSASTNPLQGNVLANGDVLRLTAVAPILGWSSNMTLSEDSGNRRIFLYATNNSGAAYTTDTDIGFTTEVEDSSSSWSGTQYVPAESGDYQVEGRVRFTTTGTANAYIYNVTDSAVVRYLGKSVSDSDIIMTGIAPLVKGKIYSIRSDRTGGTLNNSSIHALTIHKLSSPQTHGLSPSTHFLVQGTTGQNIPYGTETPVLFSSVKTQVGSGTWNPATGEYTVGRNGYLDLYSVIRFNLTGKTIAVNDGFALMLKINGGLLALDELGTWDTSVGQPIQPKITFKDYHVFKGDVIQIFASQYVASLQDIPLYSNVYGSRLSIQIKD